MPYIPRGHYVPEELKEAKETVETMREGRWPGFWDFLKYMADPSGIAGMTAPLIIKYGRGPESIRAKGFIDYLRKLKPKMIGAIEEAKDIFHMRAASTPKVTVPKTLKDVKASGLIHSLTDEPGFKEWLVRWGTEGGEVTPWHEVAGHAQDVARNFNMSEMVKGRLNEVSLRKYMEVAGRPWQGVTDAAQEFVAESMSNPGIIYDIGNKEMTEMTNLLNNMFFR